MAAESHLEVLFAGIGERDAAQRLAAQGIERTSKCPESKMDQTWKFRRTGFSASEAVRMGAAPLNPLQRKGSRATRFLLAAARLVPKPAHFFGGGRSIPRESARWIFHAANVATPCSVRLCR